MALRKQATTLGDLKLQHAGDLQDLHRKLEVERSNYEERIKQLQEANQASNGERINLSHQWKEEEAKYEKMLEELNIQNDDMKNTHESLEEMLQNEKTKDKQAWDEKKHELERKVAALQLCLAAYQHEAASVSDISRLKEMSLDQKKRLKTLQDELTTKMDLGDRLESLELKLRLKEEELTQLRATIVQNELAQKKLEDDGLKHEKLKSTHECLKGKHDNVEGHIKYLEEKSKKDHEECFSLARELKEAKDKVKEVESLSQQTKVANEKMAAELKEKVKLLEKALHQLEEESKTLEREHMCQLLRRDEEIGQLTAYSTSLKEVHRELQSKFESLKTKSGKTEDEVKAVEKQLQSTLQRAETLQKQLNSTTNAKSQLEIGRTSLLEKVKKLENEQVRLKAEESQLATLRVKHEGNLATIKAKEQELKKAKDDMKNRDTTVKALQETNRHFQVEVTKSKNFIQAKEAELRRVKEDLRFKEDEVRKAEEASSKSKDVAKATEQYLLSLCLQLETEKDKLHQTRVAKESMTAELKENVEQLERVNQQLEEEKKTLEALKSDYEKKLESLDLKLCNRDEEVDQFKVTIGQKEAKIQAAQEVLSDPSDKYSSASERDQVIQTADMHQSLDHHFQKMTQSLGQMFHDSVAKWPPGGAEVVPAQQWSLPGPAVAFQDLSLLQSSQQKSLPPSSLPLAINTKSYASTAGQSTGSPSLLEPVDPSLLQQALTLQKLMDYLPDLADKGLRIAGRLNMQKQWDSLASSHPELCDRLQKLFAMWLEGEQDSETPHTWGFFISLVQEKGIDQHRLARKICSNLNKAPAPNGASLSSSSLYLQ